MKKTISCSLLAFSMLFLGTGAALAEDQRIDIVRFQVDGNTLLPADLVQRLVAPMAGPKRVYGDIQKALEALEGAYRLAGYSSVHVNVPEQELNSGVVRLQVSEIVIGKVIISGNRHFSSENVRAALPELREGSTPNMRKLSRNVQFSNENPARQVEVTLAASEEEGKIDARIAVLDRNPKSVNFSLDNTGTSANGKWRTGAAFQHANLFDLDHVGTLAYTTSPDSPSGVKVNLFSLGYRVPVYRFSDSIDLVYGKSSVNTPSSTPTLGGALGINGKGDVAGLRINHDFPRQGENTSRITGGIDRKFINSRCTDPSGAPVSIEAPTPPIASCVPYTTRPLSLTYLGQRVLPQAALDYNLGLSYNLATGVRYTNIDGRIDRYSYLTPGNRATRDDFMVARFGGSYTRLVGQTWQMRLVANGQYAANPLVAAEQFGLAGAGAVRGFDERVVAADSGLLLNAELYTPDLAPAKGWPGNLRLLGFLDAGRGFNQSTLAGGSTLPTVSIASVGGGLRYALDRTVNLRLDVARVIDVGASGLENTNKWHAHLNMSAGF